MRKDTSGAEALRGKLDKLTEPEKRLVLAYIQGVGADGALKNGKSAKRSKERVTVSGNRMVKNEW